MQFRSVNRNARWESVTLSPPCTLVLSGSGLSGIHIPAGEKLEFKVEKEILIITVLKHNYRSEPFL